MSAYASSHSPWSLSGGVFELPRSRSFSSRTPRADSRSFAECSPHSASIPAIVSPVTGHLTAYMSHARTSKPTLSKLSSPHLASERSTKISERTRRKALHLAMHRPSWHVSLTSPIQQRSPAQLQARCASATSTGSPPSLVYTPSMDARYRRWAPVASQLDFDRPASLMRSTPSQPTEVIDTEDGKVLRVKRANLSGYVHSAALHAIARVPTTHASPLARLMGIAERPSTGSEYGVMGRTRPSTPGSSLHAADSGVARLHLVLPRAVPSQPTLQEETSDGKVLRTKPDDEVREYIHYASQHAIVRTRPRQRLPGETLRYERGV